MKNFIIGAVIGLIVIAIGIGMSTGKIAIPGRDDTTDTETQTVTTTPTTITISEKKVEEQKGKVLYTLSIPQTTNASLLQENIDSYVDGFKKGIAEMAEDIDFEGASANYSLNINYDVVRKDAQIVVIKMSASEYTGGAHGNPSFAFFIYDVEAKRMIGEEEIFTNKTDVRLIKIVADALIKKPEYNFTDGGVTKSVFFDANDDKQAFVDNVAKGGSAAPTTNGILFKYGAYAIGPYVIGEPEVEITYAQMEPFLTAYAKIFFK